MARKPRISDVPKGRICAAMDHHKYLAQTDEVYQSNRRRIEAFSSVARLAARSTIVRIPVVVHVIFNDPQDNISSEQIDSQIDALNRDFRARNNDRTDIPDAFKPFAVDTMIEFALARRDPDGKQTTGVTRTQTSLDQFPYDQFDPSATENLDSLIKHDEFGKSPWPRDDYLNLWVCRIEGGLLGYAAFPGEPASTDGVVVNVTAFGTTGTAQAPFNLGRTAVHEVGHFLDLLHIWGDDGNGCSRSDNVVDTPNQAGPNGGDVTKNSFPLISCNNGPNGDMFMNYMDYVNDGTMVMFTAGQLARMNAALAGPRKSLTSSKALDPVTTEDVLLGDAAAGLAAARAVHPTEVGDGREQWFDGVTWV
jgi:hypothetical protein